MLKNIVLIILIIFLLFFFSNNNKFNDLFTKKYIKYLFILLIVYFIYQNYNFTILAFALIILIFLNVDIKEKFVNNIYLNNLNIDNIKNIFNDYLSTFNKKISKELFQNSSDGMTTVNNLLNEVKNVGINNDGIASINNLLNGDVENAEKKKLEPFKSNVLEIKDLFESIKKEINKFKN